MDIFYKAIKVPDIKELPLESAKLTAAVLGAMALAAGALWVVVALLLR